MYPKPHAKVCPYVIPVAFKAACDSLHPSSSKYPSLWIGFRGSASIPQTKLAFVAGGIPSCRKLGNLEVDVSMGL